MPVTVILINNPMSFDIFKRLPGPYLVFLAVFLAFYYAPAVYVSMGLTDTVPCQTDNYLLVASLFLVSYILPALFSYKSRFIHTLPLGCSDKVQLKLTIIIRYLVLASAGYILFFSFFSGLNKLSLLGSDLDKETFRFIGYDDESIILQLPLELARRILLPLSAVYLASILSMSRNKSVFGLFLLAILSLFLGALVTLDRSPVLLALVTLMFCIYVFLSNVRFVLLFFPLFVVVLPLAGSVITMLQHNLLEFTYWEIWEQAFLVAKNRIWLDPLRMACRASFDLFNGWDNYLLLKYARVASLITGEYVGTFSENSIYVAPVGIVADIWRNFGYIGTIIVPTMLGGCLLQIGNRMRRSHPVMINVSLFISLEFAFYVNYGNLFSYGAILLLFLLLASTSQLFQGGYSANSWTVKTDAKSHLSG